MHTQRYLPLGATDAETVHIDGSCYRRAGVAAHDPDATAEDVSGAFAVCHECSCRGVGLFAGMTYQTVAQNAAGWDFPRAHPPVAETRPPYEDRRDPCCPVLTTQGDQFLTHQRASGEQFAWDAPRAHGPTEGPREQYQVHQVTAAGEPTNATGFAFIEVHDLP